MSQPQMPSADDLLTSGGRGRRARFGAVEVGGSPVDGSTHEGTVIDCFSQQQTTYDPTDTTKSNKPKFWENGKPAMELVITFQTMEREDANDDGIRTVYAKGNLLAMIKESIQKQNLPGIRAGGYIKMQFVHQEKIPVRKNIFRAAYRAPAPVTDDFFADPPVAPAPTVYRGESTTPPPAWATAPMASVSGAPVGGRESMLDRLRSQQGQELPAAPAQDFDF